ncbi:NB-ARC domain-containing protein [Favolaschia claudopus]|uniref:NB-ARC domain-containing protein n=1 Tax=Favolaschia claudopus TaxID=2862362 RepID=A0AAW0BVM8_9AGAR
MPSTSTQADKIFEYTAVAANVLRQVAAATDMPVFDTICTLVAAIVPIATKFQRARCSQIMEIIHQLLYFLTNLAISSEDIQSPKAIQDIFQFAMILQKIDACLREQHDLGTIKQLFKQSELVAQLKRCETDLTTVLNQFKTMQGASLTSTVQEFDTEIDKYHQELLEILSSQSMTDNRSSVSSIYLLLASLSLSPASPQIFFGRDTELKGLVESLCNLPARVVILGPGGIGKTALALAALHDSLVTDKYQAQNFISCDSAYTSDLLLERTASSLGLKMSRGIQGMIVRHLSAGPSCLMIWDNFESPWEPIENRKKVEEFLALIAEIPHVSILLTMRGAERPSNIQWTRPFLPPLTPLSSSAAYETFVDIVDEVQDDREIYQLLSLTDNLPLAVHLIANIASSEGLSNTFERWNSEKTNLLSAGYDKHSNLELSIMLSLSSPRMLASPRAAELLDLMSLLPDGISDIDLQQSNLPILDIMHCKTILIRSALAYVDQSGKLKVLAPIREYLQTSKPVPPLLVQHLQAHFIDLLKLWTRFMDKSSMGDGIIPRIGSNLGNLHSIFSYGLKSKGDILKETAEGIILLNGFNLTMNRGLMPLMLRLPEILPMINDHTLHGLYVISSLQSEVFYTLPDPTKSITEARDHFKVTGDLEAEAQLCNVAAGHFGYTQEDSKLANKFYNDALVLAERCDSQTEQVRALTGHAAQQWKSGNPGQGRQLARKAYKIAAASGLIRGQCEGIRWQALCTEALGDFNSALQVLQKGKDLVLTAGLHTGGFEGLILNLEGEVYNLKTEYSRARKVHEQILSQTSVIMSPLQHADAVLNIAMLDIATGVSANIVLEKLENATSIYQAANYFRGVPQCQYAAAELELREGKLAKAHTTFQQLFGKFRPIDHQIACLCLLRLADTRHLLDKNRETVHWAAVFLAFSLLPLSRDLLAVHQALQCFGNVLLWQGAHEEAFNVLSAALEGFSLMDVHKHRAECMQAIGDIHFSNGEYSMAAEIWSQARPLFEQSQQSSSVTDISERIENSKKVVVENSSNLS